MRNWKVRSTINVAAAAPASAKKGASPTVIAGKLRVRHRRYVLRRSWHSVFGNVGAALLDYLSISSSPPSIPNNKRQPCIRLVSRRRRGSTPRLFRAL